MWSLDIRFLRVPAAGEVLCVLVASFVWAKEMRVALLKDVEAEVTEILRDLIQIDTTNPPGNKTAAARCVG